MSTVNVLLVQAATHWHDPAANRALYGAHLDAAQPGELVVLPEMFSTGFTMDVPQHAEPEPPESLEWLRSQARERGIAITASISVALMQGGCRNRMVFVTPAGAVTCYDKRHLFRMADEHHFYEAGDRRVVVEFGGLRWLLLVCYDLRFPVFVRNREDYDAILCVANWPAPRQTAWETLLAARAIENLAYCVGVNRVGEDGAGRAYDGGSGVFGPDGSALLAPRRHESGHWRVALDVDTLNAFRRGFPAHSDRDDFALRGVADGAEP